jgi:hypothetical protein
VLAEIYNADNKTLAVKAAYAFAEAYGVGTSVCAVRRGWHYGRVPLQKWHCRDLY